MSTKFGYRFDQGVVWFDSVEDCGIGYRPRCRNHKYIYGRNIPQKLKARDMLCWSFPLLDSAGKTWQKSLYECTVWAELFTYVAVRLTIAGALVWKILVCHKLECLCTIIQKEVLHYVQSSPVLYSLCANVSSNQAAGWMTQTAKLSLFRNKLCIIIWASITQ